MKTTKIIIQYVLSFVLLNSCLSFAYADGEDTGTIHSWDFNEITDISEFSEFINTNNSSKGIESTIEGEFLKYSKNGTSAYTMYLKFADYVSGLDTYMAEYDLKAEFDKNKSFILRCGTNFQFVSQGNGEYIIQCYKDSKFVSENTTTYDLSEARKLAFVVRGKSTVDLYIETAEGNSVPVYEGLQYTISSTLLEDSLGFTFNASSNGSMYIKDINLTTTVPIKKDITKLEFKNCSKDLTVDKGDKLKIEIAAEATSGIEKIDIYANNEKYATLVDSPYIVDLSDVGSGDMNITATAVSNSGDSSEKSINIKFRENKDYEIFSDNEFNNGDGSTLKSGITLYSRRGYAKADTVDEEHGKSLLVGIDTADTIYAEADVPYADIPINSYKGYMSFECDMYVDAKEDSGKKTLVLRTDSSKDSNIIRFKSPQMLIAGSLSVDYESKTWYHFMLKVNSVTGETEIFIDDMPVFQYNISNNSDGLKLIRLYGPGDDSTKCFTALDNIKIKGYYDIPEVLTVEDGNDVSSTKFEITEYLSAPLYEKSINTETVKLLDEDGNECMITKAFYSSNDNSVTVVPQKLLMPCSQYKIVISADAKITSDITLGEEVEGSFKTLPQNIEVEKAEIKNEASLCKASVKIKNVTDSDNTVYVVMTLWNNEKGIDMKISPLKINADSEASVELQTTIQDADSAEIYIYNDIKASEYLCERIYRKEF